MTKTLCIAVAVLALASGRIAASDPEPDSGIIAAVEVFHDALKKGDAAGAMAMLAADAQILEGGHMESRAEYEKGHLEADMEFARSVPATRENVVVRQEGRVAWVTSSSRVSGSFKGRDVNSAGAELMVLTRTADGWRIRAIHWSSHAVKRVSPSPAQN